MSASNPKILVILHDKDGNLNELAAPLAEAGLTIDTWDVVHDPKVPSVDSLGAYDGIISLGAQAGVLEEADHAWMTHEKRLLERALQTEMPVLGLCFGSQLLAAAGGAAETPAAARGAIPWGAHGAGHAHPWPPPTQPAAPGCPARRSSGAGRAG